MNLGGIKSYYGPTDEIYMEVFYRDSWIKTLIFASSVPLSITSAQNQNIYRSSVNANDSTEQTTNFPRDTIQNEMYSDGNFPVEFVISATTVTLEATFRDSIFDSGLYKIFEYEINQSDYSIESLTTTTTSRSDGAPSDGIGRRLEDAASSGADSALTSSNTQQSVFVNVSVQQEVFIDMEIFITSSISGLENYYELQYLLRRQIERISLVYIDAAVDGATND